VLRGSARPTTGARINLGSFYAVGLPVALLLGLRIGFVGLWCGLLAAQATCATLMLLVLGRTDWSLQARRAKQLILSSSAASSSPPPPPPLPPPSSSSSSSSSSPPSSSSSSSSPPPPEKKKATATTTTIADGASSIDHPAGDDDATPPPRMPSLFGPRGFKAQPHELEHLISIKVESDNHHRRGTGRA
jgi:MATE family multidrug resistance protein